VAPAGACGVTSAEAPRLPDETLLEDGSRGARANRVWLYAGRALRSFSTAFLTVVFPLYLASEGYSVARIGLVLTAGGFISAVLVLGVGLGGDRLGRKRMLIWVAALAAAGSAALAVSSSLVVAMLANGLAGVGRGGGAGSGGSWGPVFPAEQPLLAASAEPRARTKVFGHMSFIGVAAGALGSLVAYVPEVAHRAGWTWAASYRLVFVLGAVLSLLMLATMMPIREPRPARLDAPAARRVGRGLAPAEAGSAGAEPRLSTRQLLARLGSVNALNGFGFGFLGPLLTYWLHVRYGVGPGQLGVLYTVVNLVTMAPYLGSARVAERLGTVRTVVWTRTAGLAFLLALLWTPTFLLAGVAYALRMAFNSLGMPARQSYVMGVTEERRRSTVAAVGSLPSQLSSSVSPVVGGALMSSFFDIPIVGGVVFMAANVVAFYFSFRRYRPPEEVAAAREELVPLALALAVPGPDAPTEAAPEAARLAAQ
jgi:MFS family permease